MPTANLKKTLRTQSRQQRMAMPMSEISRDIVAQLRNWDVFQSAQTILAYWPLLWEVDVRDLMRETPEKKWYLPKIEDSLLAEMKFYLYDGETPLQRGPHGLMEPSDHFSCWLPEGSESTLVLCPALMADMQGYRLGAGRGYYDRFFENLSKNPTGCAIKHYALVPALHYVSALPVDVWDKPVDGVVTDAGCYTFNSAQCSV
jgi:5-formyltetrahydrofolate cyclo-ligase